MTGQWHRHTETGYRLRYPLSRPARLSLAGFSRECGLHPELVRRFVTLGLLDTRRDAGGELWFAPAQLRTVARIQRLRTGLCANYAAIGVILDLLDRIDRLENALRRSSPSGRIEG
jgi:chaperone modulatory protein CbpM